MGEKETMTTVDEAQGAALERVGRPRWERGHRAVGGRQDWPELKEVGVRFEREREVLETVVLDGARVPGCGLEREERDLFDR